MKNQVRYVWNSETQFLYGTREFLKDDRIEVVPYDLKNRIYVNILEVANYIDKKGVEIEGVEVARVKLFYASGETLEGWVLLNNSLLSLDYPERLYDGRFNA
jgi:hypothetical protein